MHQNVILMTMLAASISRELPTTKKNIKPTRSVKVRKNEDAPARLFCSERVNRSAWKTSRTLSSIPGLGAYPSFAVEVTLKQNGTWSWTRSVRASGAETAHPKWGDVEEENPDTANRMHWMMAAYPSRS